MKRYIILFVLLMLAVLPCHRSGAEKKIRDMGHVEFKAKVADEFRGTVTLLITNQKNRKTGEISLTLSDYYIRELPLEIGDYSLEVKAQYRGKTFSAEINRDHLSVQKNKKIKVEITISGERESKEKQTVETLTTQAVHKLKKKEEKNTAKHIIITAVTVLCCCLMGIGGFLFWRWKKTSST